MAKVKRTAKWHKLLTMEQLRHLAEMSHDGKVPTLARFTEWAAAQKETRDHLKAERIEGIEPCWTCKFIARKLGLEV